MIDFDREDVWMLAAVIVFCLGALVLSGAI